MPFLPQNDRRRSRAAFAFSLALHLSVLLVCFWWTRDQPDFAVDAPIEVVVQETVASPKKSQASRGARSVRKKPVTLDALGMKYDFIQGKPELGSETNGNGSRGSGFDLKKDSRDLKLNQFIYASIDEHLYYPSEFSERNMQGVVDATLTFSKEGIYLGEQTEYQATSPYFRALVAKILRQSFENPIPANKLTHSEAFKIFCKFRFAIAENHDLSIIRSGMFAMESKLSFYRQVHQSVLEWKLGPLRGLGPMVNMDLLWFGKYFSKKPKIDPLERYRESRDFQ